MFVNLTDKVGNRNVYKTHFQPEETELCRSYLTWSMVTIIKETKIQFKTLTSVPCGILEDMTCSQLYTYNI